MNSNYNGVFNTTTTSLTGVDAKGSRELFQLPAGPVSLALGGEFRREKLDINPSDANRNFLVSGFGAPGVPISAKRKVGSTYAEMTLPVVKGLEVDAAGRYDYYERVGHTTNPKGSIRWQPINAFLVRASLGTGFRAPTLADLFSPQARGITTNGSRDLIRCPPGTSGLLDCSTQFVTNGGGNPDLKPEKSKSGTVGVVLEPIKNYSIGIDYFRIEVKDVIRTGVPTATILGDPVTYASYIHRGAPDGNPSGVGPIIGIDQLLTNLGQSNVDGFDVDLKARLPIFRGNKFTVRLNGTYLTRYDQQNLNGTYSSAINQPAALGIGVALRWRHTTGLTWQHGGWVVDVAQNYQVGYHDLRTSLQPATVTPRKVAPYETYDLQIAYSGIKSTKLTLGVKNVLDRDPPYTNYGAGFVGGYDLSYTDVRGRFVYLTAKYSL
jgi:iron complex outermembrane receptor protein